jgi:YVTN family beta-propeller protein
VATIPVPNLEFPIFSPGDISITPDGTRAYVANTASDTVTDIATATNTVVATVTVGDLPTAVAFAPCNSIISGTFSGNVTVSAGQNLCIVSAVVTGNVQQSGGHLTVASSTIDGNVQITGPSTFMFTPGTTIDGNLQVQNLPAGTAQNQICGTTVKGVLQFQNNGTAILIGTSGPPAPACPADTVNGDIQAQQDTAAITIAGDTVGGVLQAQQDSGALNITGNTIGADVQLQEDSGTTVFTGNHVGSVLQVQNNTGTTNVTGNTVTSIVQVQNNTAPTQVFTNSIGFLLQCENNTSITGGGNTAEIKQGQCVTF